MRVVLVGNMVGSCGPLRLVAEELEKRGNTVQTFFEDGKPGIFSNDEVGAAARESDFVLVGMASSVQLAVTEMEAVSKAFFVNVPYGFFADTFGVWARPWLEEFRSLSSLVCVLNDVEASGARKLFPKDAIVATGNPSRAGDFFPTRTKEEVRALLDIPLKATVPLLTGTKTFYQNVFLWGNALGATQEVDPEGKQYVAVICPHPGELNEKGKKFLDIGGADAYKKAYGYRELFEVARCPFKIVTRDILSTDDVVPGVDLIIQNNNTVGDTANAQRIPVLEPRTALADNFLENVTGKRTWPPIELGVSQLVTGSLAESIRLLESPNVRAAVRTRQEAVYPKPASRDASAKAIVAAIEERVAASVLRL